MNKFKKIEPLVKSILEKNEQARKDNFILIAEVYYSLVPEVADYSFTAVMLSHKEFKLPSFESITRARRKLQREYEDLRPSEEVQTARLNETKEYIDYAINYKNTFSRFVESQD
jgi:hypothetical protein